MESIETIELGSFNDGPEKIINADTGISSRPSVNFGPGAELLMNDKKINSNENMESDINLGDLENL